VYDDGNDELARPLVFELGVDGAVTARQCEIVPGLDGQHLYCVAYLLFHGGSLFASV